MRIILVALLFSSVGCRKCVRGHDQVVTVPARTYFTYQTVRTGRRSTAQIPIPHYVPEHQSTLFVCEQWEDKK